MEISASSKKVFTLHFIGCISFNKLDSIFESGIDYWMSVQILQNHVNIHHSFPKNLIIVICWKFLLLYEKIPHFTCDFSCVWVSYRKHHHLQSNMRSKCSDSTVSDRSVHMIRSWRLSELLFQLNSLDLATHFSYYTQLLSLQNRIRCFFFHKKSHQFQLNGALPETWTTNCGKTLVGFTSSLTARSNTSFKWSPRNSNVSIELPNGIVAAKSLYKISLKKNDLCMKLRLTSGISE